MGVTTESRLKNGLLTIGGIEWGCQSRSVKLTPPSSSDSKDGEEVLCGNVLEGDGEKPALWQLELEHIQDFTDPEGLLKHLFDNDGEIEPYSWKPNATGPTFTGTLRVKAAGIGGDVNARLKSTVSLDCQEKPTWTPAA